MGVMEAEGAMPTQAILAFVQSPSHLFDIAEFKKLVDYWLTCFQKLSTICIQCLYIGNQIGSTSWLRVTWRYHWSPVTLLTQNSTKYLCFTVECSVTPCKEYTVCVSKLPREIGNFIYYSYFHNLSSATQENEWLLPTTPSRKSSGIQN